MIAPDLTPRAGALLARLRPLVLDVLALPPAEGDPIIAAIVATLSAARHEAIYPLGELAPTEAPPSAPPGGAR